MSEEQMYFNALNIACENDSSFLRRFKDAHGTFKRVWEFLMFSGDFPNGVEAPRGERLKNVRKRLESLDPAHELSVLSANGVRLILFEEEEYPRPLLEAHTPPLGIYVQGDLSCLDNTNNGTLGVVGTRTYSPYGKIVCENLLPPLVERGVSIISGFALGIDTFAHSFAIRGGGKTVGVLGSGLGRFYPQQNKKLAKDVVEKSCGAIISEYHFLTPPLRQNFPRRNRIVAALSRAVLVVEASLRSGSLITARQAVEMGRDVFAVPGQINSRNAEGTNALIKDGALIATSAEDLLQYFGFSVVEKTNKEFDPQEKEIVEKLDAYGGMMQTDSLLGMYAQEDISRITSLLTQMELKDIIEISGTNIIKK